MSVDVIIRTLAEAKRRDLLLRAVGSLLERQVSRVRPIIVLNGSRQDPALIAELRNLRDAAIVSTSGDFRSAFLLGRSMVTSPYFAFLDDDDQYLPSGIDRMLEEIEKDNEIDLLVTNGYRNSQAGAMLLIFDDATRIKASPLRALLNENWLYNCGGIYRTSSFPTSWFEGLPNPLLFEWTWIACKATLEKRVDFCSVPTFIYSWTPGSLSKSWEMTLFEDEFLMSLASMSMKRSYKRLLRKKRGEALHVISDHLRKTGRRRDALRYHLRSLLQPGGWRYTAYSRHLLAEGRHSRSLAIRWGR